MKVKSESEVAQSCPTLSDPMDCSPPGSSVHGIFQARVLEWGAIALSHTKMISMVIMMQDWVLYELCLLLPLLVYIVLDVLANAIGQGRKIKDIRNE